MRGADPFAALVDFMAFMVLISIFLFILSDDGVPNDAGSRSNVISFRVTSKSAIPFSQELRLNDNGGERWADVEYSLWLVDEPGRPIHAGSSFEQAVIRNSGNESTMFAVAPEASPETYVVSISHLSRLDLVGTYMELAVDVQIGKKSCSLNWSGRLGADPGVLIHFDDCRSS